MSGSRSINVNISPKVAVAAALGTGMVIGAGAAYFFNRFQEHTHLVQQITNLHVSILEVLKKDLNSFHDGVEKPCSCGRCNPPTKSARFRKTVSFSSTATSASYRTAPEADSDNGRATDTDYFSPDEDDDEFFDLSGDENDGGIVFETQGDSSCLRVPSSSEEDQEDDDQLIHLLERVDRISEGCEEDQIKAYNMLKAEHYLHSDNPDFLWRLAKSTRNMSCIEEKRGDMDGKKRYIFEAFEYAAEALRLNEESAEVHKWYGILAGAKGEFLGTKERIHNGKLFKTHIDRALQIKPHDATLHHLLGRFCYEVAQLSWLEQRVAAALFAEIPSSTIEETLEHFMAAEKLRPSGWKENRLLISKCYIQMDEFSRASAWLEKAAAVPCVTPDDEMIHKEVKELQNKYS